MRVCIIVAVVMGFLC